MSEKWKQIPGYEGFYDVSDMGRVRSWYGKRDERDEPRVMKPGVDRGGYHRVGLQLNGARKFHMIHRLVMLAFVGESSLEVNHKNGIKSDNRPPNLEYCTRSENCIHARDILPSRGGGQVLSRNEAEEVIALLAEGKLSQIEIAGVFGVAGRTITDIWRSASWANLSRPWTVGTDYKAWKNFQNGSRKNQPIQQGA